MVRRIRNRMSKPALKNEVQVVAPQQPMPPPRSSRQSSRVKKNTDPRRSRGLEIFLEAAARLPARSDLGSESEGGANAEPKMSGESLGAPSLSARESGRTQRAKGAARPVSRAPGSHRRRSRHLPGARRRRRAVAAERAAAGEEQRCGAGPQAQGDPLRVARDEAEEARSEGPAPRGGDRCRGGVAEGGPPLEWVAPHAVGAKGKTFPLPTLPERIRPYGTVGSKASRLGAAQGGAIFPKLDDAPHRLEEPVEFPVAYGAN